MLRTNLNEIIVFMAVADAGSFVGGGEAVGLTRSAAGKAVGRLEDRLGSRLLNRTTRKLSLTNEGRLFYDHGLQIVAAVDDAEASVAGEAGTPRGLLRLTVPNGFGRLVLLPLIRIYLETWPDLQVEVSFTDRPIDIVEEGFDLAVRIGDARTDSGLVSRVVARYKIVLCAAPSYLAAHGTPGNVGDLEAQDCLTFCSRGRRQRWRFRGDDGNWVKIRDHSRMRLDSGEALRDAAILGAGIAKLPDFLVEEDLLAGRLHQVLPDLDLGSIDIATIYPSRRLLEPSVRRFIDLMSERLRCS